GGRGWGRRARKAARRRWGDGPGGGRGRRRAFDGCVRASHGGNPTARGRTKQEHNRQSPARKGGREGRGEDGIAQAGGRRERSIRIGVRGTAGSFSVGAARRYLKRSRWGRL